MTRDTDSAPLSDAPLTPQENRALRGVLRDDERATWAWKKIKVIAPAVIGVAVVFVNSWDWLVKHVRFTP
jgi:hypothetical protein